MGTFRRRLATLAPSALALLLIGALGWFDGSKVTATGNYTPSSDVTLSSNAAAAVADTTYTMHIDGGQPNFGEVTAQSPGAACVGPGPETAGGDCPAGPRPQLGDVVGTFSSSIFLGLSNTPCSANLTVTFVFLNATVTTAPAT